MAFIVSAGAAFLSVLNYSFKRPLLVSKVFAERIDRHRHAGLV